MSFFTTATRIWLTKSKKPFTFTNDYDKVLDFAHAERLGLYIHIPFCRSICSFCPYCKEKYNESRCNAYVDALISEITRVGASNGDKKQVTSLYFGGGSPALALPRLGEILAVVHQFFTITEGIGLELHPAEVTIANLTALKQVGITKISIGVQSFQDAFLDMLGRDAFDYQTLFHAIQTVPFETVSMDFIFALPNQTVENLKIDIETAFANGSNHIAIYPFIDFTFAKSGIPAMKKREKRKLLDDITAYCAQKGYHRDSIWTFSKVSTAKYSSMTRDNFLGFGCSATTLLKGQFKVNTFSVDAYCNRIAQQDMATALTIRFTKRQRMIYYLFWTAYSTQVDAAAFANFFGESLHKNYGFELKLAQWLGFATYQNGIYQMTPKGAFYYHYYENFYTLAYIDKMWRVMRKEDFPERMEL